MLGFQKVTKRSTELNGLSKPTKFCFFAAISVSRIFTLERYLKRRIRWDKAIVARVDFMVEVATARIESVIKTKCSVCWHEGWDDAPREYFFRDETSTFVAYFPCEGLKMEFPYSFVDQTILAWLSSKKLT